MSHSIQEVKRQLERCRSDFERLNAVHRLDQAIISHLDLAPILDVLLDQVMALAGIDAVCVLRFNSSRRCLDFAVARGFWGDEVVDTSLRLGVDFSGKAALDRQMVVIDDLSDAGVSPQREYLREIEKFVVCYSLPMVAQGALQGVMEVYRRSAGDIKPADLNHLTTLASQAAQAIQRIDRDTQLHQSKLALELAYDATLDGWVKALELRHFENEGHCQRVCHLTMKLIDTLRQGKEGALVVGFVDEDMIQVQRGALLHDIGKLALPDVIMLKGGPLSEQEWEIVRQHPLYGYQMLGSVHLLAASMDVILYHHERWDGLGYPRRLAGSEIPISARAFALADVWDSLTHTSPYKEAWTPDAARAYVSSQAGKQFDPLMTNLFLSLID